MLNMAEKSGSDAPGEWLPKWVPIRNGCNRSSNADILTDFQEIVGVAGRSF